MRKFPIETREIGGDRVFVIAEAGVNHNGDVALAEKLVDVAADAGVDAVKFQTFDPELIASARAEKAGYQKQTTGESGSQLEMLRKLALPREAYARLRTRAKARGIVFMSTPFDEASADLLASIDVPAFKISSGDLTNIPLLEHVAAHGRPVLLSTGMATMFEITQALGAIERVKKAGHPSVPVGLFHCVSNYPTRAEDVNLRAMATMRAALDVPVGWSDHTSGIDISIASVALGAEILEKHFTLDRNMPGPDHRASLEPGDLADMMRAIRRVEAAVGDGVKRPRELEGPVAAVARRSLHYREARSAGDVLRASDVVCLRPEGGLPPSALPLVIGARLERPVAAGAQVVLDDLRAGRPH